MPIEKQSLNNFLPNGFETLNQEGYKENFSEDKIATGYEKDVPDIVSGPNLNNLIDVVGKNTNTLNNYVEYLNGMPINNVPYVNQYNQLDYKDISKFMDNKANIDLDNLSDIGLDKLKTSKMYITGAVSEDEQGFKQLLEMKQNAIETGIDVIKPDNYEIVGSPVISDDGVASGFSNNKYLYTNTLTYLNSAFKVRCRFTYSETDLYNQTVWLISSSSYVQNATRVSVSSTGRLAFQTQVNSKGYSIESSTPLVLGATYDCEAWQSSDGSLHCRYKTVDSNIWTEIASLASPLVNFSVNLIALGIAIHNPSENFLGSIDLNLFKIYINGNLVYQPCLKIPYTESKTGSKIVDRVYRDRVIDLYEQQGQAGYYTIDEENQNFTLPMGEIYGMIEDKVRKSGDTMNGILNFDVPDNIFDINIFTNAVDNYKGVSVKNNYADSSQGTVSVQEDYMQFASFDKNDKPTGLSLVKHQTNGNMMHCIRAFKQIDGVQKQCEIAAVVDVNGNAYGIAPTWTTYTDSSTKIATTAFVQNALKVNSSMPSKKVANLSFPASEGTNYTAPADGYFILRFCGSSSTHGNIYNSTTHLQAHQYSTTGSHFVGLFLPASKGDVVKASYHNVNNNENKEFKFIYANSYA